MTNLDEVNLANFEPSNDEMRIFFAAISSETRTRVFAATAEKRMKPIPLFENLTDELRDQPEKIKNTFRKIVKYWSFVDLPKF